MLHCGASWPCNTQQHCRAVAQAYAARWLIEEYHKALKSGTGVAKSQLETAPRIQALLAVLRTYHDQRPQLFIGAQH